MRMIFSTDAPKPVAAYSQAVESGGFVFTAGQIGVDPQTNKLEAGLEAQAERVFSNLSALLQAAGSSQARIVKATIFMTDLSSFAMVNRIYERFVGSHRPARTTVACSALPMGALIEVDLIAQA